MLRKIETAEDLDFTKLKDEQSRAPIVPVIVVDEAVLLKRGLEGIYMVGFATQEAVQATIDTGLVTFFSRSRQKLWTKGETSGNTLQAVNLYTDCDKDTLLISATAAGPVCHNGTGSCFETPAVGQ